MANTLITAEDLNSLGINPETGLPTTSAKPAVESKDTLYAEDLTDINPIYINPISAVSVGGGEFLRSPEEYDFDVVYGQDNADVRAKNQSTIGLVGKGLGRLVSTAGTKLLQGAGFTLGLAMGALDGNLNMAFDNGISELGKGAEDYIKEDLMPVYKTKAHLESGNLLDQMFGKGSSGFWADDVVDGVAFLASAYIQGAGVQNLAKGSFLNTARNLSRITTAAKTGRFVEGSAMNVKKIADVLDYATISAVNSANEAAFEARDTKDEVYNSLGLRRELGLISDEEALNKASNAAKTTFGLNMGALFLPNMLEARMMFKTPESLGVRGLMQSMQGEAVEGSTKALTRKQLAGIFAKDALLSAAVEGPYEENIQLAIQNYSKRKALGKENRPVIEALAGNMLDNFSTMEGQKSIVLGSMLGLIPGGMGGVASAKAAQRNDNAINMARGAMLQRMQGQAQDFYKKQPQYDTEGNFIGESDAVVIDSKGNPVFDQNKIAAAFEKQYQTYTDMTEMLRASASGNDTMFNYIKHNRFADAIVPLLATNATEQELEDTINFYAGSEVEDLQRAGKSYNPQQIEALKSEYKESALKLKGIYDSIQNNFAGTYNFGNTQEAAQYRDGIMLSQYYNAADQVFWDNAKAKTDKSNTKQLEQIDKVLEDSYTSMKDLLNYEKQLNKYEAYKAEAQNRAQEEILTNAEAEQDTDTIEGVNSHAVVDKSATSSESILFTPESAKQLGYENYKGRPSHFIKEDKETGRTSSVITDAKGNIMVSTDTISKDMLDPRTGEELKASVVFRNGQLTTISTVDKEGTINYSVLPEVTSLGHEEALNEVVDKLPEVLGLEFVKPVTAIPTRQDRQKAKTATVTPKPQVDEVDSKADFSKDDVAISSIKLGTRVLYNGKTGKLADVTGTLSFIDDNGNATRLTNLNSTAKVKDLGLTVLRNSNYDITVPADSNSININNRNFDYPTTNKLDSILRNNDGDVTQINLIDKSGTLVSLTNKDLINDIANTLEEESQLEDKVFDSILQSDKVVIAKDPKDNIRDYAVYRKNGNYIVTDFNGKQIRPEAAIYKRVIDNVAKELRKVTDLYKKSGNTIKDKATVLSALNGIRQSSAEEALRLPAAQDITGHTAVQTFKPSSVDNTTETELVSEATQQATATAEVMQEDLVEMDTAIKNEVYNGDSILEALNDELTDPNYQVIVAQHGVKDSSSSVAYVWFDSTTNQFVTGNPEFETKIITTEVVQDLRLTAGIDYSYTEFWDKHPGLMPKVKAANSAKEVDELLNVTDDLTYNNIVDILPISLSLDGTTTYMHRTGYDFIKIPAKILEAGPKAVAEYKINIKLQTRYARRQVLQSLLLGGTVHIPIKDITAGTPNSTVGTKNNIGDVLNKVTPGIDLRTIDLGIAVGDGTIVSKDGQQAVGFGKPGNVFLITSATANNTKGIFKLNPSYLSQEHAYLLFEAYKQAMTKGSGGFKGEFKHELVSGLTIGEAIDLLVRQGELFTKVSGNKAKQHLINKQLWSKDGILYYGVDSMNILEATSTDIKNFVEWATTNKRYAINKDLLGKPTKNKSFKLGSITFDPGIDNYNSMVIKSNLVTTDIDVVPGTNSLTKQPVVIFDLLAAGINTTVPADKLANDVIDGNRVSFVDPDSSRSKSKSTLSELQDTWGKLYFANRNADLFNAGFINTKAFDSAIQFGSDTFAAHGMAKSGLGTALNDLITLFSKNVDLERRGGLDTAALTNSTKASTATTGGGVAYRDGAFILVAKKEHTGKITDVSQIGGILVNDGVVNADPKVLTLLQNYFPTLVVDSFNNVATVVQALNKPVVQPIITTTVSEQAPAEVKDIINTVITTATEAQEGLPIGPTFKKIATMPEGSTVYFLSEVDGKKKKDIIGTIKNGKFVINVAQQGMYAYYAGRLAQIGTFKQDNLAKITELAKGLGLMSANIKYDTPAVTVQETVQAETKAEAIQQTTVEEQKPIVEERPTTTFKNTGARNLNDLRKPFGLRLRTLAPQHYTVGDVVKATEWLQKNFKVNRFGKGIEVQQVEKLIELAGDRLAFGQFKRDSFVLSKALEIGTEYHEAFHRVSLGYLTDTERNAIYTEERKFGKGTDLEIEERLAEKFRDYMLLKDANVEPKTIKGKIKEFFKNLYDFITTWFTGKHKLNELTTEALFKAVKDGKFQYAKISKDRYTALRGKLANFEAKGKQLTAVKNNTEFREVVQGLFYTLVEANGLVNYNPETNDGSIRLSNIEDIKSLKLSALLDAVIQDRDNALSVTSNVSNDLEIAKNKPSKEQLLDIKENVIGDLNIADKDVVNNLENIITTATKMGNILAEVVDNFDVYSEALQDFMMSLNVTSHTDNSDIEDTEVDEEDGSNASDFDKYNKVHFESSAKHNTAANIKLLLSVLPESTERSELTGMYKFAEYGKLWSKLQRDLLGFVTAEDMMNKLRAKAEGYVPYSVLIKHLEKDETLKTQFYVTVKKSRIDFVNALIELVDKKPSIVFSNAAVQTASNKLVKEWNTSFSRNPELFKVIDGESKADANYFNTLSDRYTTLYRNLKQEFDNKGIIENIADSKEEVLELLQSIGVTISTTEFDGLLNTVDPSNSKALVDFMFNKMRYILGKDSTIYKLMNGHKVQSQRGEKKVTFTFDNAFTNESVFKSIADAISSNDPILLGDSVLGANGAKYYTIAQHTYISNTLDLLKSDPNKLNQLKSAEYNKRSKFIEAFSDNETLQNFRLRTLAAFIREDSADAGRGYQDISDLEDYLLRIIANNKGLLTPPTPADRRFYSFYEGINKLDGSYNANGEISNETLEVFRGYYLDEVDRATLVRDQVEKVIHGKMSAFELIEGFHFKYIEASDIKVGDIIFDGTSVITVSEGTTVNPNLGYKLLKRKGSYTGRGANMVIFNGAKVTDKITISDINSYIKEIIKREVAKADELGIILADNDGNVIKNLLLPESILTSEKTKVFAGTVENEALAVESIIADSTINSMFAAIETTKVFTGDISAYKSFDDYVKRLPNYTSTGDNTRNDFPSTYYSGDPLVHSHTYNTAVFTSHVIESKYYDTLVNKHADAYMEEGLFSDRDKAVAKAKERLEKLLEVDQTDAQTFISPAMYRATAIKLGEWNPQKEAAFNLLMGDRELTPDEYVLASEAVMQPLKMTYMNVHFENGHAIPVLDKQSMATMFRKVVKGTQMEDLLDRMEAVGKYSHLEPIHQVKFNTANKVGIKDRKRLFEDASESNLTDLSNINSRPQYFEMLRKQLVTDPHAVSATLVGSQFKKIGMSNVEFDKIYSNGQTGREIVEELHATIGELSDRGLDRVIKEFNLSADLKLTDKQAFVNKLKDEARRANMPDYLVESFKLNEDGNFYLEMDSHPGTRKWIQSRIISYIKKETIDLKLPGNVFIQMSNIGLRKADKSDDLKFFNEKGNIECKVSVSLFSSLLPNDIKHDFEKSRQYLLEHPELTAMAYRIPTQAQDSTYTLEVVDFLPNSVGDVIVLPAEGTAIGGFDFDIDKLYVIRHNYDKQGNKIEYKPELGLSGNSKEAVENRMLDLYFTILKDPKHFTQRTQPLGYGADILKNLSRKVRAIKGIEEDPKIPLFAMSPTFQLDVKAKYKFGGQGLGAYALANVHHVLGQLVDLGLNANLGIGNDKDGLTSLSAKYGKDGELITEWFSALIDAHVDIAADPFIYYLNVNAYTRDVVTLLLRAGVGGVNTMLFVAQPILEDIAKQLENKENEVGFKAGNVEYNTVKKYKELYKTKSGQEYVPFDYLNNLSTLFNSEFAENMMAKQDTAEYYKYQLDVYNAFEYLNKYAASLTQATLSSRVDTKKFGNNISEINSYSAKLENAIINSNSPQGIRNFDKLMESTYLGKLTDNSINTVKSVLGDTIIEATPAFENTVKEILKLTGKQYTAGADFINKIADELYVNINTDFFYNYTELNADKVKSLVTGKNSIAKRLQDIRMGTKLTEVRQNEFLNLLTPVFEQNKPDSLRFSKPDDKWGRDGIVRAWKDLLISENEEARELAKDLFYYSLVSSGFKNTMNSYFDLAPRELLIDTGYNDFIKQVREYATVDNNYLNYYIDELFINAWNNDALVPSIDYDQVVDKFGKEVEYFVVLGSKAGTYLGSDELGAEIHKPYIKFGKGVDSKLYKYLGTSTNDKGEIRPLYKIVEKRSYFNKGNIIRENGLGATLAESQNKLNLPEGVKYYLDNNLIDQLLQLRNKEDKLIFGRLGNVNLVNNTNVVEHTFNPISDFVSTDVVSVIQSVDKVFESTTNIETDFYTLPDKQIVFVEKTEGNKYLLTKYGYRTPTKEEIDERIKQCE